MSAKYDGINGRIKAAPRAMALIGPHGGGKTSLLESIAKITGAIQRKGAVASGTSLGDANPEARTRQMSVGINMLSTRYLDEDFMFLDCPGSIEFLADTQNVLTGIDAAIVVSEPDPAKIRMLQPYLKLLADSKIPHFLFINKFDKARGSLRALLMLLQDVSPLPLLLRQIPIWEQGVATGFVDLALERAFVYRPNAASEVVNIADYPREKEARFQMLERLADHDEHLMEELLGDVEPPLDEVFCDLRRELAEGLMVPVLIGSADGDHGVRRLLKALRHEVPDVGVAAARAGLALSGDTVVQILKTYPSTTGGRQSLCRVLSGGLKDGTVLHGPEGTEARLAGIWSAVGEKQTKHATALPGDTVLLGRLEGMATGDRLSTSPKLAARAGASLLPPVYRLAVAAPDRKDEVKLTSAIARLCEEDPSLRFEQNSETQEMILAGQGEVQLKVALERLARQGLKLTVTPPRVAYRETIRKHGAARGRHKRQTGGHGQFGDVLLEVRPTARGSGFAFQDRIKGGVVPRTFIGSVEKGVHDYMKAGPLGFPVVDIEVALTDGSYHTVDSSDAAFQTAGRLAMSEAMPGCLPVLLEPVMRVNIHVPNDATAKVNGVVGARRGTPLGFDARTGWPGWDTVRCEMPLADVGDLIVDLRSLTQGVGTYDLEFDRWAELNGKLADQIVATRRAA